MDLNKMVADSLAKMDSSGKFQEIIDTQLEKTMSSIVKDLFGEWSDFSKELKTEVEEKLKVNLDKLNLQSYNHLIMESIKNMLDDEVTNQGVLKIKSRIEESLVDSKREYKLSELTKELSKEIDGLDELEYDDCHEMSLHIDDSYSSTFIHFDSKEGISEYSCKYRLFVSSEGKIISVNINDTEYSNRSSLDFDVKSVLKGLHGIDEILFTMFVSGAKLIIDEDYCQLEISNPEYD